MANETNLEIHPKTLLPILKMAVFELCQIAKFAEEYNQILLRRDQTLIPTEFQFMSERFVLKEGAQ